MKPVILVLEFAKFEKDLPHWSIFHFKKKIEKKELT
jgi:hypothetical protein